MKLALFDKYKETAPWLMFFNLGKIQIYVWIQKKKIVFLLDDKKL